jgi:hypothetical protein
VAGFILWLVFRNRAGQPRNNLFQNGVLSCVLICALAHQFTLAISLALIATCFGIFKDRALHFLRLCLLIVIPLGIFWLLFGVLALDQSLPAVIKLIVKYPSIYWFVLGPFFSAVPRASLIFFPVLLIGAILVLRVVIQTGKISAPSLLLGISIMMLVAQSALVTPEKSTRYTFFLYPCLLLLFCYFCFRIPVMFNIRADYRRYLTAGILIVFVIASENYNPRHLLHLSSAEYNFRMPYHRFLQFHFYQRYSYTDVADFVNNNVTDGDQIIATTPVIDYYLDRLDFSYREMGSGWFLDTSACSGTRHIWSHTPLIYTQQHFLEQIASGRQDTWIITGENGKGQSPEDQFVSSHYAQYLTFTGRDSQVKVYRIPAGS